VDKAIEEAGLTEPEQTEKFGRVEPKVAQSEQTETQKCKAASVLFRMFSETFGKLSTNTGVQAAPIQILWDGMRQGFAICADTMEMFANPKIKYVDSEMPDDIAKAFKPVMDLIITSRLAASNNKEQPNLPWVNGDETGE